MQKTSSIIKNLAKFGAEHLYQAELVELDGYGLTAGGEQSAMPNAGSRSTAKVLPPSTQPDQRFVGGDYVDVVMK